MFDKTLEQIADRVLNMDEATLTALLPKYKKQMESFEPTEEWEKAVIIFFLINAVRVKNSIFNDNIIKSSAKKKRDKSSPLKLVK